MNDMYSEKMENILNDLENKEIEIAGGSVVGMVLATVNSLIKYISNLTVGKKRYEEVQDEVKRILNNANRLKIEALNVIDEDKQVLEKLLTAYKIKGEDEKQYIKVCREAVEFCMKVVELAFETLELSYEISKVGNKMLSSDFKICKYYSFASIQSGIANVEINLKSIDDDIYKNEIMNKYNKILKSANNYMN